MDKLQSIRERVRLSRAADVAAEFHRLEVKREQMRRSRLAAACAGVECVASAAARATLVHELELRLLSPHTNVARSARTVLQRLASSSSSLHNQLPSADVQSASLLIPPSWYVRVRLVELCCGYGGGLIAAELAHPDGASGIESVHAGVDLGNKAVVEASCFYLQQKRARSLSDVDALGDGAIPRSASTTPLLPSPRLTPVVANVTSATDYSDEVIAAWGHVTLLVSSIQVPCIHHSNPGTRGGMTKLRPFLDGLFAVIRRTRPRAILLECVVSLEADPLFKCNVADVLSAIGYDLTWFDLDARGWADVARNRLYIVASIDHHASERFKVPRPPTQPTRAWGKVGGHTAQALSDTNARRGTALHVRCKEDL